MSPRGIYNRRPATANATANDKGTSTTEPKTPTTEKEEIKISAKVQRAVDAIRNAVVGYFSDYSALETTREVLAPKFMKVFRMWQAESGGTLAGFVRTYFTPDLPMAVKEYKAHHAYQAADYLRRKDAELERAGTTPVQRAAAIANRPVTPRIGLARVLASVLPMLDDSAITALRKGMSECLHWSDAVIDGLLEDAKTETPVIRIRQPRGVNLDHALKASAVTAPSEPTTTEATAA